MAITVLIVDDSKLARIVAAKALNAIRPDWQRVEAANADEALAVMAERDIDVALIDFNMPGRDGLQLASELRALRPAMPIALVTANIQEEVVARARAVAASFVEKPLTEAGLRGFIVDASRHLGTKGA